MGIQQNVNEQEEYEVLLLKRMIKYSTATFISVVILFAILMGKYFSTKDLTRFYDTLLVFQTIITLLSSSGQIIATNKLLKRKGENMPLKKINKLLTASFFLLTINTLLNATPFYKYPAAHFLSTIFYYSALVTLFCTWIYSEILIYKEVKQ